MLIRREREADVAAVRAVVVAAFGNDSGPEPIEAPLLDRLRADTGWLPALSLVAVEADGSVVGHVVCTRGAVAGTPALGLGPLAVRPDHQRQGVGSALVHAVLGAAEALEESVVCLLGDPAYYERFGFRPASELGIGAPEEAWGRYFQARALGTAPRGRFSYARPFDDI